MCQEYCKCRKCKPKVKNSLHFCSSPTENEAAAVIAYLIYNRLVYLLILHSAVCILCVSFLTCVVT